MRINLFGGPGAGKSTTAAWLFSELKKKNLSVEHVGEYVKAWAYQKRPVKRFDQVYILGKQMQAEYRFLSAGVRHIITDSPLFNSYLYAPEELRNPILAIIREYDAEHPSVNIFLDRGNKTYHQEGRYQSYEEAKEFDEKLKADLKSTRTPFLILDYSEPYRILEAALNSITYDPVQ